MDARQHLPGTPEGRKRWPGISEAILNDKIIKFLSDWSEVHDTGPNGIEQMKDALHGYVVDQLKEVSVTELIDALAESISNILLNELVRQLDKLKEKP